MPCPICGDAVDPPGENLDFPFCSRRCRLVDLGNWLGGRYRMPTEEPPGDGGDDAPGEH